MNSQSQNEEQEDLAQPAQESLQQSTQDRVSLDYKSFLAILYGKEDIPLIINILASSPNGLLRAGQSRDFLTKLHSHTTSYSWYISNPERKLISIDNPYRNYKSRISEYRAKLDREGLNDRIKLYKYCKYIIENAS